MNASKLPHKMRRHKNIFRRLKFRFSQNEEPARHCHVSFWEEAWTLKDPSLCVFLYFPSAKFTWVMNLKVLPRKGPSNVREPSQENCSVCANIQCHPCWRSNENKTHFQCHPCWRSKKKRHFYQLIGLKIAKASVFSAISFSPSWIARDKLPNDGLINLEGLQKDILVKRVSV